MDLNTHISLKMDREFVVALVHACPPIMLEAYHGILMQMLDTIFQDLISSPDVLEEKRLSSKHVVLLDGSNER